MTDFNQIKSIVNSGGLYRVKNMAMFQITERKSSIDAACAPEHFDTFFKEIGQKLRGCRPKHDLGGGSTDPPTHFLQTFISQLMYNLFK